MGIVRDQLEREKEKQQKIINEQRPTPANHYSERGILQKLTQIQKTTGLYTAMKGKRCPFSERERLLEKFKGEYEIKNGVLSFINGINYIEDDKEW